MAKTFNLPAVGAASSDRLVVRSAHPRRLRCVTNDGSD
jgi:hypothetical protein